MNTGWTLEIKNQAWTEDTENQVDFLIREMNLTGRERILDLACGYGRHALSFARKGFSVVGVDFTKAYIDDAMQHAEKEKLNADFILADIREVSFYNTFDVVLNLADGAIGYFPNEEDNLRIFDVVAAALKPGGKHFMDICNADHADRYFPKRDWLAGEEELSLSEFTWNPKTRKMCFTGYQLPYGKMTKKPVSQKSEPTRLYLAEEVKGILANRDMHIVNTYSDYYGAPLSPKEIQLMVYSQKAISS